LLQYIIRNIKNKQKQKIKMSEQPKRAASPPPHDLEGDSDIHPDEIRARQEWVDSEQKFYDEALNTLEKSHAWLFEGRIPEEFEKKLQQAGYKDYAVGFNQSEAIDTVEEAEELLTEYGGIELGIYNLGQRFLVHDQESPMPLYPMGYDGPKFGRFVYAFPTDGKSGEPARVEVSNSNGLVDDHLPHDMFVEVVDEEGEAELVVNAKYCVGFIDGEQTFHLNEDFMEEDDELEQPVRDVGNAAMQGTVELRQAEVVDTVAGYLEREGLDIDVQTQKFEDAVTQRVQVIWDNALAEGRRQLNSEETEEIRRMNELVVGHREFVGRFKQAQEAKPESQEQEPVTIEMIEENALNLIARYTQIAEKRPLTEGEDNALLKAQLFVNARKTAALLAKRAESRELTEAEEAAYVKTKEYLNKQLDVAA
jgi:hypothetical protein